MELRSLTKCYVLSGYRSWTEITIKKIRLEIICKKTLYLAQAFHDLETAVRTLD